MVGDGKWLTVHEVATRLRVSDGTARSYIDAGKIEHEGVMYNIETTRLPGKLRHRRAKTRDIEVIRVAIYGADETLDPTAE